MPSNIKAKINPLVLQTGKATGFISRAFLSKPSARQVERVGRLFGYFEFKTKDAKVGQLLDHLIADIKDAFYGRGSQGTEQPNVEEHFERALQRLNSSFAQMLQREKIRVDLKNSIAMIGVVRKQKIFFAPAGRSNAFVFHHRSQGSFQIIDIMDRSKAELSPPQPIKFFAQILNGRLNLSDTLFFCNDPVLDYLSLEKIKNVITSQDGADASQNLKLLLQEVNNAASMTALIIKLEGSTAPAPVTNEAIEKFDYQEAATRDSMRDLVTTESATEKMLTPTLVPEIKKQVNNISQGARKYLSKISVIVPRQKNETGKLKPLKLKSSPEDTPKKSPKLPIAPPPPIKRSISREKGTNAGTRQARQIAHRLSELGQYLLYRIASWFKRLPGRRQLTLVLILIALVTLATSVISLNVKRHREATRLTFTTSLNAITDTKNEAEASLIYRDEGRARTMLIAARDDLNKLKAPNKAYRQALNEMKVSIEGLLSELRHEQIIDQPVQIANFANLDAEVNLADFIELLSEELLTQNLRNDSLTKLNINNRQLTSAFPPANILGSVNLATSNSQEILYLINRDNRLFIYNNSVDEFTSLPIELPSGAGSIAVEHYNERLYFIDIAGGQILRYRLIGEGIRGPDEWLSTSTDLTDVNDLAIDGSIYLLGRNGQISRYENGEPTEFSALDLDPKLSGPTSITTPIGSEFLYVLDPPTKRIVVLDKNGQLVSQYITPNLNNLKNVTINEDKREIYLLDGTSIFAIPATHLE